MSSNNAKGMVRLVPADAAGGSFPLWYVLQSDAAAAIYFEDGGPSRVLFWPSRKKVLVRVWEWVQFWQIYEHLAVTLIETMLAFAIGTGIGLRSVFGLG